jgi:hypothetical protein
MIGREFLKEESRRANLHASNKPIATGQAAAGHDTRKEKNVISMM